jgi:predicted lipid-binding transport protein (Tim44 family)
MTFNSGYNEGASGPGAAALHTSDIFDLTNILLLAVAVIIFLRLRSVLGRRTGNERPHPDPYAAPDAGSPRESNVITLPRTEVRPPASRPAGPSIDERLASLPLGSSVRGPLRDIAAADPAFEAGLFLSGAKVAYETIITAYAHGDRETLRNLLSPEVYDSFNAVIAERESRGETAEFSFVGLASADISDGHLDAETAHITVRFVSDLVTAVRDRAGSVVEGDLKAVRRVTDVWTFARDVRSANPNWRLVATDSAES